MNTPSSLRPLAITQGDPAGIGPEIIAKAFRDAPGLLRGCFAVGDLATLRRAAQCLVRPGQPELPVAQIDAPAQALDMPPRCLPVLPLPGLPGPVPWGQVSAQAGSAAAQCVVWAARAALRGEVAGLVTAPLHKESLHAAGVDYPGHTELLQAQAAAHAGVSLADMPERRQLMDVARQQDLAKRQQPRGDGEAADQAAAPAAKKRRRRRRKPAGEGGGTATPAGGDGE